jgi:hypothetical protein
MAECDEPPCDESEPARDDGALAEDGLGVADVLKAVSVTGQAPIRVYVTYDFLDRRREIMKANVPDLGNFGCRVAGVLLCGIW